MPAAPKWFAALGLLAGLGAVVAPSCCVIPLGLAALSAASDVLGGFGAIASWRAPLLSISALGIIGVGACGGSSGPLRAPRVKAAHRSERSRMTLALLLCASAILLAAANWSDIDPVLLKLFRAH
jgi:mercuric ion transport protein